MRDPVVFEDVHIVRRIHSPARHGAVHVDPDAVRLVDDEGRTLAAAPLASVSVLHARTVRGRPAAVALSMCGTTFYLSPAVAGRARAARFADQLVAVLTRPKAVDEEAPPEQQRSRPRAPVFWDIAAAVGLFVGGTAFVASGGVLMGLLPDWELLGLTLGVLAGLATAGGVHLLGGGPPHYLPVLVIGIALPLVVASGVQDLVLSGHGRWTDSFVVEIEHGKFDRCRLEHPDGTRVPHDLTDEACGRTTRVGDRITVIEDPGGLVAPASRTPDPANELTLGLLCAGLLAGVIGHAAVRGARAGR